MTSTTLTIFACALIIAVICLKIVTFITGTPFPMWTYMVTIVYTALIMLGTVRVYDSKHLLELMAPEGVAGEAMLKGKAPF